ncbi:TetR/AcrR family transcriptional regulator [Galbibacter mesophilus]|uniref:TetR/AcrR family transcriptional regulator n=1 Tax=Galbibacter mesophilus TaxID=379069 RepID=UPI00191D749F|nr:TetR/AcrR family transcriptional regulator [Galbibacter mesophilus]MCM5664374.1 TetR/AcrR family transcriptional regulator [Galbibacter mesophilus]
MDQLLENLRIRGNEKTFLKDPESTDLGRRIIEQSIILINEIGFEAFTFKKLATQINSTESSVYRYFENKHKLLLYLSSWYWAWLEYQLVFATYSLKDPHERLNKAIEIVTRTTEEDSNYSHVNEVILNKIVINEFSKSFLTKEVDRDNKEGYFQIYKRLVNRLEKIINEVNEDYEYSKSLASTLLESTLHQHFLREHFPTITTCDKPETTTHFLTQVVNYALKK